MSIGGVNLFAVAVVLVRPGYHSLFCVLWCVCTIYLLNSTGKSRIQFHGIGMLYVSVVRVQYVPLGMLYVSIVLVLYWALWW